MEPTPLSTPPSSVEPEVAAPVLPVETPGTDLPHGLKVPQGKVGDRVLHFLTLHNPFYLLSAASMLGGCILLTNSTSWSPIKFTRLLTLLATINLYELLLLGLGLFLVARRGEENRRDAGQLLVLAVVFMLDAAFLVSELVSTRLVLGSVLSGVLLMLSVGKFWLILRVSRVPVDMGRFVAASGMVLAVFVIPCVLKYVGDTRVTSFDLLACWWIAFVLWLVWDIVSRTPANGSFSERMPVRFVLLMVALPYLSLLTHIGILHYVYNHAFTAAHAAPVLLALTLILARLPMPINSELAQLRHVLQVSLPAIAFFCSNSARADLSIQLAGHLLAPGTLTLATAYFVYAWVYFPNKLVHATLMGGGVVVWHLFGPTLYQMLQWITRLVSGMWGYLVMGCQYVVNLMVALIPRNSTQWGVISILASFGLLALGARITLKSSRPSAEPATLPPPPPSTSQP